MSTMKYILKKTPNFVPLCPVACQRCLAQDVSAPVGGAHESKWPSPAYPDHQPLYPVLPSVDGIAALVYLRFEKWMNWVFYSLLESSASKFIITWETNLDLLDSPSSALPVVPVVQICCWLLSVWYLCAGLLDCKDVFRLDTFVSVYIINWIYRSGNTHLSATATASGSVGGIMKHTAGTLMVRPFASFTSHFDPLFLSRVYRSPRKMEPCVIQNEQSKLCFNLILQHKLLK